MGKPSVLSSKEIFSALLEIELKRSLRYQSYLTLLLIEAHITNDSGRQSEKDCWARMTNLVRSIIRETDLIGVPEQNLLTIMLLNSDSRAAVQVVDRLSTWISHCLDVGSRLSIGRACFPTDATDLDGLFQSASGMLAAARTQRNIKLSDTVTFHLPDSEVHS